MTRHEQELRDLDLTLATKPDDSTPSTSSDPTPLPIPSTLAVPDTTDTPPLPEATTDGRQGKVSKAQQKRDRRAQQEKDRRHLVAEELKDAADPRRDENAAIQRRLDPLHLRVAPVLSDGHCLFRAVATQLPSSPPYSPSDLRRLAAGHIRRHLPLYLPFLVDEEGGVMTEEEGREYCSRLEKDAGTEIVWGGHAEIVALTGVLRRGIVVFSAEGKEMRVEEEGLKGGGDDVRISFHKHYFGLGNHYNAVVRMEGEDGDEEEHESGESSTRDGTGS